MTADQNTIIIILIITIALFVWGRWRHDLVAGSALLACVFSGLVQAEDAFTGLAHPAVITVACVLVLSRALQNTGLMDSLAQHVTGIVNTPVTSIIALSLLGAVLSSFMNNIGAMALLMPVAVQMATRLHLPPGRILMPLAFGTILGGMTTLIGTPPNLIVSGFREQTGAGSFGMFDFSPVGVSVASVGILFIVLLGWRLVPKRERNHAGGFDSGTYLTEARVTEDSSAAGKTISRIDRQLASADAEIRNLVRNGKLMLSPNPRVKVKTGDILVIEAEPESMTTVLSTLGLVLEEDRRDEIDSENKSTTADKDSDDADNKEPEGDIVLQEVVVMPDSALIGKSARSMRLRTGHGVNLLAISRQGDRSIRRLRTTSLRAGDVLLLQGTTDVLYNFASEFGCVPLASRNINIPDRQQAALTGVVMTAAIAGAAFGLLPAAIAFAAGVAALVITGVITADEAYASIDWSIIVLLAALIPVAGALSSTGTADVIAAAMLDSFIQGEIMIALALVLVVTMTLSDFMNNAATAAMMCPIAISVAAQLGASSDAFLMAVAIGASCAFLTPVGHQSNTLIMGPGGFRFGDYWKMGLPLEILVVAVSVPMLLLVWA